jgi:hypothetical protein
VNAIPSESRTPSARRWGRASFRDVAIITGPLTCRFPAQGPGLARGKTFGGRAGLIDGTRRATKARREGSGAGLTSQGRVGLRSRHVVSHRESHRLLSAKTSSREDALRQARFLLAWIRRGNAKASRHSASRFDSPPSTRPSPRLNTVAARLVSTEGGLTRLSHGESRGKGVLAV